MHKIKVIDLPAKTKQNVNRNKICQFILRTEAKLQLYTALEQRNEIESGDKQCKVEINSAFLSRYFVHANLFLYKYKLYHTIRFI